MCEYRNNHVICEIASCLQIEVIIRITLLNSCDIAMLHCTLLYSIIVCYIMVLIRAFLCKSRKNRLCRKCCCFDIICNRRILFNVCKVRHALL